MIQILFSEISNFSLEEHFGVSTSKNEAWCELFFMLIFWIFLIAADKIEKYLNSAVLWEILSKLLVCFYVIIKQDDNIYIIPDSSLRILAQKDMQHAILFG